MLLGLRPVMSGQYFMQDRAWSEQYFKHDPD